MTAVVQPLIFAETRSFAIGPFEATNKIMVKRNERATFWEHFRAFMGHHPAISEHDLHPDIGYHEPVGISGDDAKYTLAGRKIIILMLNFLLQEVQSTPAPMVYFVGMFCCCPKCLDQVWRCADFLGLSYATKYLWGGGPWTQSSE